MKSDPKNESELIPLFGTLTSFSEMMKCLLALRYVLGEVLPWILLQTLTTTGNEILRTVIFTRSWVIILGVDDLWT